MPATAAGTRLRKQLNVAVATSSVDPTGALLACNDQVRFEQHSVEDDILFEEGVKHRMRDDTGNFLVALVRMQAFHQRFWLNDRHEPCSCDRAAGRASALPFALTPVSYFDGHSP
jgi:hypothetical protein